MFIFLKRFFYFLSLILGQKVECTHIRTCMTNSVQRGPKNLQYHTVFLFWSVGKKTSYLS